MAGGVLFRLANENGLCVFNLESDAPYWLFAFPRMTYTFSCLVSFQESRKTATKTQPRGKSGRAIKLGGQLFFLVFMHPPLLTCS